MGDNSAIQWTDATWNPTVGCKIVSPGCANCYAMKLAARLARMGGKVGAKYAGLTVPSKAGPVWTGTVRLAADDVAQPLKWRAPRRIFVNSMSDVFAEDLPDAAIDQIFAVMTLAHWHTFQVLTKRADRMHAYITGGARGRIDRILADAFLAGGAEYARPRDLVDRWPLPNVWLGVSTEDQRRFDERVERLGATPAAVRFVSAEPLLGYIDVGNAFDPPGDGDDPYRAIDWVIVGGESTRRARPMHPEWARSLRDQCQAMHVPFFFKQWGEFAPSADFGDRRMRYVPDDPTLPIGDQALHVEPMRRLGTEKAGRTLDLTEHNEFPRARETVDA